MTDPINQLTEQFNLFTAQPMTDQISHLTEHFSRLTAQSYD